MKFHVDKDKLFPNEERWRNNRPVSMRKARKLANNLVRDLQHLPLAWERLTGVQLIGEMWGGGMIKAWLYFEIQIVHITGICVSEDMEIMQKGTHYGALTY